MGPAGFACVSVGAGHRTVRLAVSGEVDLATVDQLDRALSAAQRDAELVTLDLRRLRFMDCQGLAVVMSAATRAQVNGARFRVVRGPPAVNRVFVLTGIDRKVEMTSDTA